MIGDRSVVGLGWVEQFFFFFLLNPIQKFWQPNLTQPSIFGLGSDWVVCQFFFFKFYLSTVYNYWDTILDKIY